MTLTTEMKIIHHLPGDEIAVQALGCAMGMSYAGAWTPYKYSPDDVLLMAGESMRTLFEESEQLGTAWSNSPELFRHLYSIAFLDGYSFGVYATAPEQGMLALLSSLERTTRYNLVYNFFRQTFMPTEDNPFVDPFADNERLKRLDVLYKQYQATK